MDRRELLKKLFQTGAGAAGMAAGMIAMPVIATPSLITAASKTPDEFMHKGWRVKFGGWREIPNQDVICCVWVAYSTESHGWHLYSAWPGNTGPFVDGSVFDISRQKDQTLPNHATDPKEREWIKIECLEKLKRSICRYGSPPIKWDQVYPKT